MTNQYTPHNPWLITVHKSDSYAGVVAANGRIGILPEDKPFRAKFILMNNVYDKEAPQGVSKVLLGLNFANLNIEIDGEQIQEIHISNWSQTLNMKEAGFNTNFTYRDKAEISYTIYALRNVPYTGYIDIQIKPLKDIKLKATGRIECPDSYLFPKASFRVLEDLETTMPILQTECQSPYGRHTLACSGTFIWHAINSTRKNQRPKLVHQIESKFVHGVFFEKDLKAGENFEFAWTAALCSTTDFEDPQSESERFVIFNLLNPREALLDKHKVAWEILWEGDIVIEGDPQSQQDVRLALYHLYAFSRADSNLSIAPMGLSSQNYNGHIFWDTELWMFPPLLLLNPSIAKSLLNYRFDRLEAARNKAINYGYKGAMFPWESDDTGEEATPTWALTGTFEHHITACVGIACWNYYRVSQDQLWLEEKGFPLLKDIADYWVSRSTKHENGSYSILNVVGANEFAPNVDDNAFTNGAAITALQYATKAAEACKIKANPAWAEVAENLLIHKFPDGTTMEHSKYSGDRIKQADVNLLAYPLDIVKERSKIIKDLEYYEPRLAEEGPAMGKSVFAVIYARLGDADNAFRLFKESYEPNKRAPFGALAESALSNNPYFATGAGGMLQVILFGFAGLVLSDTGLIQKNPILPKNWKSLKITGLGTTQHELFIDSRNQSVNQSRQK
ncbi:MAG: glycoside hydrolase family 65 protein [Bacteroidota bacterium]